MAKYTNARLRVMAAEVLGHKLLKAHRYLLFISQLQQRTGASQMFIEAKIQEYLDL